MSNVKTRDELFEIAAIGTPLEYQEGSRDVAAEWKWALEARAGKVYVEVVGSGGGCNTLRLTAELTQADVKRLAIWLSARATASST